MLHALDNGTAECSLSSSSSTSSSRISLASVSVSSSSDEELSDQSSQQSAESDDEIPIWVNREQRWISGITGHTTCGQLIEVLLRNEGMLADDVDAELYAETVGQYAITERWRRVEQMLDNRTKVMKIWKAWGPTRQEVCILTHTHTHIHDAIVVFPVAVAQASRRFSLLIRCRAKNRLHGQEHAVSKSNRKPK